MGGTPGQRFHPRLPHSATRQVEELRFPRDCHKILPFFRQKPYFQNDVVVKECVLSAAGKRPPPGWAAAGARRRVNPILYPAPSPILVFQQDTVRPIPLPSSGTRIMNRRPTVAGTTTPVLTPSTGSLTTALPCLATYLRWGPVTNSRKDPVGSPAAWDGPLSPAPFPLPDHHGRPVTQTCAVQREGEGPRRGNREEDW